MSINIKFRAHREAFTLDVDLTIPSTALTVVFGPSGSGKTTLLRALAGLDHHKDGRVVFNGAVWQDDSVCVSADKRRVGYVFQEPSLFPHLSVRENIRYGLRRSSSPSAEEVFSFERVVDLFGISELLDRKPEKISGGEQQRVAIARAVAMSPRVLLMDEPFSSVDRERRLEMLPYIESLNRDLDIPIIYVTHSVEEAARLADHMILLEQGTVLASGGSSEIFTRLDLPLVHRDDAGAVIDAQIEAHDDEYQLTYLSFPGGAITVIQNDLPVGSKVKLRVAARDVSLTLQPQQETSILNILEAEVQDLEPDGGARVIVRLSSGGVPLLARLTRKSAQFLQLAPGKHVYAQIKSVALLQ